MRASNTAEQPIRFTSLRWADYIWAKRRNGPMRTPHPAEVFKDDQAKLEAYWAWLDYCEANSDDGDTIIRSVN